MKQENIVNSEQSKEGQGAQKWTGAFLILMGVIFFASVSGFTFQGYSPWILMALLPAYWIGVTAYKRYKEEGRVTRRVYAVAVFGLLPFAYIAAAILGFDVSALWPLGIIAVGVSFILFGAGK
jgi:hypothetical protein